MENIIGYCADSVPKFLGLFDFSIAPQLLLYSYIPIIIVSIILGLVILIQEKRSKESLFLFGVIAFFALWVLNILIEWVAVPNLLIYRSWQMISVFEICLYIFSILFAFSVIRKNEPISRALKIFLWTILFFIFATIFTRYNIKSYDFENCEGVIGVLWIFIYIFEVISSLGVLIYGILRSRKESDQLIKKEILFFTIGIFAFMSIFSFSNIYGELTKNYQFNFIGPFGMIIFIGIILYLLTKYKVFNVKVIGTQILVFAVLFLIGSLLFVSNISITHILIGATFILLIIFGQLLIKSVKKEIEQREQLEILIRQRESLMHLITHKVKGSFTHSKYIFAEILEGTFGEITPTLQKMAEKGLQSDNEGISTVDLVLNAANLKTGTVKFDMKPVDFKALVTEVVDNKKGPAESKGLKLETDIREENYTVLGDKFWLKEVVLNLVDNAVKYTDTGKITVGLQPKDNKILFYVKDTGGGITDEDKKVLFTEGGRGMNSVKKNTDSTGYGLFTIKMVVDSHKGRVWEESEIGKGTTFFVELPL